MGGEAPPNPLHEVREERKLEMKRPLQLLPLLAGLAGIAVVFPVLFLGKGGDIRENDRNLDRMQRTCQQEQLVGKNKDEVSILFGDPDQIHDLKDGSLWTYDVSTLLWRELDIGLTPFNIRFDKEGKVVDFGFRKS